MLITAWQASGQSRLNIDYAHILSKMKRNNTLSGLHTCILLLIVHHTVIASSLQSAGWMHLSHPICSVGTVHAWQVQAVHTVLYRCTLMSA